MDPQKCLADLDAILRRVPLDRDAHAHVIACVNTVAAGLKERAPDGDHS